MPATPSIHHRTCSLCEAMCGLRIEHDGARVLKISGDPEDPLSRGYLCPKGPALAALQEDPDRLKAPLRRDRGSGAWREVSWDEAIEAAADGLHGTQRTHGRDAVGVYLGNPTVHSLGGQLFTPQLVRGLRTRNRFSATSVDQLPHQLVAHYMYGHQFLIPIPDVDRTQHLLILGGNPLASNGSLMSAPDMKGRIAALQARGGKLVVVDPRRSETAAVADEHHFIRPGTDAWLLGALVRIALDAGRGLGRLAPHAEGVEALREAVARFAPERAAERTGIDAATIERLGEELCAAPAAICYGRLGTSTQAFGGLCNWFIQAINLLTGNFDRPGGVLFTNPAIDAVDAPKGVGIAPGSHGRWTSRVRGLPEFGGELPVAALAEEILTEGEGQIRAMVTSAGNPVLSTPNGTQLERAFAGLDFMVSIDFYLNETTRYADVILPPPSPLERAHYDIAFQHLAVRNTAKYAPPLFDPPEGQRHEWQIMLDLVEALERRRGRWDLRQQLRFRAFRRLGPRGMVALGLRVGPYGQRPWPLERLTRGLRLKSLQSQPSGVDLGPLRPSAPARFKKWRDKIDLCPAPFVADLDRLEAETDRPALRLIGRRHLRSNNSWMHNAPKLVAGKPLCTLLMHPEDAAARALEDGATVTVESRVGAVEVPLEVSDEVMKGVVSLPHGFGHGREGVRLRVASTKAPGVSVNDLTDDRRVDALTGNADLNGVPVEVRAS
jgi:anaerobic selenocysteine-containing dehydrogenase